MSKLINHIASYCTTEVTGILANPAGKETRLVFEGLPFRLMALLLDTLVGKSDLSVPVFLIESNAKTLTGLNSGKCTDANLVNIRNSTNSNCYLTLLPIGAVLSQSNRTSSIFRGVAEEPEGGHLINDPFVSNLIEVATSKTSWEASVKESAILVINKAMTDAARLDIGTDAPEHQWKIIERIFEVCFLDKATPIQLLAALGLPPCEPKKLGTKEHLIVLDKVGQEFETSGIKDPFDSWMASDSGEIIKDKLASALEFIRDTSASNFAKAPSYFYRISMEDVLANQIPKWWESLDLNQWEELLQSDIGEVHSICVKAIAPLVAQESGSGLPTIFQKQCSFEIQIDEENHSAATVKISVSKGTKDFTQLALVDISSGNSTFTHDDPPIHQTPLRYRFEAEGFEPKTVRVIALDRYLPGVIVYSRGASKLTLFKKQKKSKGAAKYDCDIEFKGVGTYHLDILNGKGIAINNQIASQDTSSEINDIQNRPINKSSDITAAALIQTDDESSHEFTAEINSEKVIFKLHVRALDSQPVGATSEFDRLILEHRSATHKSSRATRVEPVTCLTKTLGHWLLEDPNSYYPLVIGEDYVAAWNKPDWKANPVISMVSLQHDPRPENSSFLPPNGYLTARLNLQTALRGESPGDDLLETIELGERMRDQKFRDIVDEYLSEYIKWLKSDFESAAWADVVTVHRLDTNTAGPKSLASYPHALLLTPMHPARFGWQCVAQSVLQHAIDQRQRCPGASILDPRSAPDCLVLPCRTPVGKTDLRKFLSVASNSDYWGVFWSGDGDHLAKLNEDAGKSIFDKEFGITIDGLASGFSVSQVERAIDEISNIWSAKSALRISITSDTIGSSSCNEGITSWGRKSLGEQDPWNMGGGRSLEIYDDRRIDLQPEDAELSALTQALDSSIHWFSQPKNTPQADLAIIAHLGTQSPELSKLGLASPIDAIGLNRVRIRKQLTPNQGRFIAESRVGSHKASPEAIDLLPDIAKNTSSYLSQIIQFIESRCGDNFDSYVFMPKKPTLEKAIDSARYCAVSSSNIDPACFFNVNEKSYLWDYDLPSYSRRAGENNGFYLIANESPTICQAVKGAIKQLKNDTEISDETISALIQEISHRGVPTLKKLTNGGTASLGEIGVLTCLRALQSEFSLPNLECIFPTRKEGSPIVNMLIPVDPFRAFFDELRQGLELQDFERPDLLSLSLQFEGNQLTAIKVTPIEVKARAGGMNDSELKEAIGQARIFASFLEDLAKRASEQTIWGIVHRNLISSWLDYAFRVYGQLPHLMESTNWHKLHGEVISAILSGRVIPQVDSRGRLFVVGTQNESEKQDLDNDGLPEALLISHSDAYSILTEPFSAAIKNISSTIGDWELTAKTSPRLNIEKRPITPPPTPIPIADNTNPDSVPASTPPAITEEENIKAPDANGLRFPVGKTVSTLEPHDRFFYPSSTELNQLNIGIVGDLGVGKTQLIKALIYQIRNQPAANRNHSPNILILDYKKDYSEASFVKKIGAKIVTPRDLPLNLFDIKGETGETNIERIQRTRCFIDILNRIYPGIGPVQQERLRNAVKVAYATKGEQSAPTIYDVFNIYKDVLGEKIDAPYSIISDMVEMNLFTQDPSKVMSFADFISGPVVIDLGHLKEDNKTKNVIVAIMLNLYFAFMLTREKKPFIGTDPKLRYIDSFLLVDEASNIMQYEFDVLKMLLLQGREFGMGILLASQYLSHFKTSNEDYREPLLTWFVHKVPQLSVKDLVGIGLTDVDQSTVDRVKGLQNHHCLYKTFDVQGEIIRGTPFFELIDKQQV